MSSEYQGMAVGGPLDGKEIDHAGRKGFVHWDLDINKVTVYDRNEDGDFVAGPEQDFNDEKIAKAQMDDGRKVLAFGTFPEFHGDDLEFSEVYDDIPEIVFDEDDDEVDNG